MESLKIVTHANSSRIAKFAFDYAVKHGRKKVTAVHKANIMSVCSISVVTPVPADTSGFMLAFFVFLNNSFCILWMRYFRGFRGEMPFPSANEQCKRTACLLHAVTNSVITRNLVMIDDLFLKVWVFAAVALHVISK